MSHLLLDGHQVEQSTSFNPGQVLATATLRAVPTLASEEMNPNTEMYQGKPYQHFPPQEERKDMRC